MKTLLAVETHASSVTGCRPDDLLSVAADKAFHSFTYRCDILSDFVRRLAESHLVMLWFVNRIMLWGNYGEYGACDSPHSLAAPHQEDGTTPSCAI